MPAQGLGLESYADPDTVRRRSATWAGLSRACRHHGYELVPMQGELCAWRDDVERVTGALAPRMRWRIAVGPQVRRVGRAADAGRRERHGTGRRGEGRARLPTSAALAPSSYAYYDAFVAKTRISISLEQDQAERIRQHAERASMDVSAYLVHAATRQMAESDAIEEQFAEVDALIARAERAADGLPAEPTPEPAAELTEQERREVEEALGLVHGRDRQGHRQGHAA